LIYKHYEKKKDGWLRWFAWKPAPIGNYPLQDGATMVWWEWIERKWLDSREGSSRYIYRLINPAPTLAKTEMHEPIEVDDGLMGVKDAASVWE
jgi:hypothetical protein